MHRRLIPSFLAIFLTGCVTSTTGPFVTEIAKNDHGELVIEKCMLKFNSGERSLSRENCIKQNLKLENP